MEGSAPGGPFPPQPVAPGPAVPNGGQYAPTMGTQQYPQQPGYGQLPYQGHQQQGPGVGERAADAMQSFERHIRSPETKPFFKTSEFAVWLVTVLGVLIAGATIDNGDHHDVMKADLVWILVAGISAVYVLSRGISKAGTRYREDDHRGAGRGY